MLLVKVKRQEQKYPTHCERKRKYTEVNFAAIMHDARVFYKKAAYTGLTIMDVIIVCTL